MPKTYEYTVKTKILNFAFVVLLKIKIEQKHRHPVVNVLVEVKNNNIFFILFHIFLRNI